MPSKINIIIIQDFYSSFKNRVKIHNCLWRDRVWKAFFYHIDWEACAQGTYGHRLPIMWPLCLFHSHHPHFSISDFTKLFFSPRTSTFWSLHVLHFLLATYCSSEHYHFPSVGLLTSYSLWLVCLSSLISLFVEFQTIFQSCRLLLR